MRIKKLEDSHVVHYCPGCQEHHVLNIAPGQSRYSFNENYISPTLWPAIHLDYEHPAGSGILHVKCRYFITQGSIKYSSDCAHILASVTVELPELEGRYAYQTNTMEV